MGLGTALGAFAGGFQASQSLKLLKEEKERNEKLAKEKEANAINWYTTNKEVLTNFQSQPQETRNMLLYESTMYSDDWHKLLRDFEDAIQDGDLEQAKHINDMLEEQLSTEGNMLELGVKADKGFMGKYYTPESMDYVKKLRMGALSNKPIGTQMYEESYGKLPAEAPETPKVTDYNTAASYLSKFINAAPETFNQIKAGLQKNTGLDLSAITQQSLKEPVKVTVEETPEGEITAGQKRTWDMASSVLFGSSDWVTGISKPGIISQSISGKLNMGQPLTKEENTEVRNNYNAIKGTLPDEIKSVIESQLKRYGIPLEEPIATTEPVTTTPKQPGIIDKGVTAVKDWLGMKGTPEAGKIPTPKVPTGEKEALIPTMSNQELHDTLMNTDPSDPIYKSLYDEAVKRGLITK